MCAPASLDQPSERCANCPKTIPEGRRSLFCSPACKKGWFARSLKRGQVVAPFVQAAALARHAPSDVGRYSTRMMWALARKWNAQDAAAGRMNATDYAKRRMDAKWAACDTD